jgi:drug/metabolite transporter (DMT)-like permease
MTLTDRNNHRRAIALLCFCTLCWSIAGVFVRHLDSAQGFEVTFWRSLFCLLAVFATLWWQRGRKVLQPLRDMGRAGLVSGAMWAVMFTCFTVALTLTTTANTLLVSSIAPLLSALLARAVLGERVRPGTWIAILVALVGIWWMVRDGVSTDGLLGMLVALGVPMGIAINLVTLRKMHARVDLAPAVLLGALFSCLATLPLIWPLSVSLHDLAILALLGTVQLALPCMLMVRAARHLAPQEMALIGLLEVVLGPVWSWLGASEAMPAATIQGGIVVITALVIDAVRGRPRLAPATPT